MLALASFDNFLLLQDFLLTYEQAFSYQDLT